jgi:hypothetical protein
MLLGAALLCWRHHSSPWPWVLVLVTLALVLVALFWPKGFQPIDRGLKVLQDTTVRIFSWAILLLVFVLIFVPGRWLLHSRLRVFWRREKMNTYWLDGPSPTESQDFQRQF